MPAPEKSLQTDGWLIDELIRSTLIAVQNITVSVTNTTNETELYSVVIPKNTLGKNGILRVLTLWYHTNSANIKTLKIKFGGVSFVSLFPTTTSIVQHLLCIRNRNNNAAQVSFPITNANVFNSILGTLFTATVDTSVDQILSITGQLALSTETINLESVSVEVVK